MSNLRPNTSLSDEVTGNICASQSKNAKGEANRAFNRLESRAEKDRPIAKDQFDRLCEKFPIAVARKVAKDDEKDLSKYLREQLKVNPDFLPLRMAITNAISNVAIDSSDDLSQENKEDIIREVLKLIKDAGLDSAQVAQKTPFTDDVDFDVEQLKRLMSTFYMTPGLAKKNGDDSRRISKCELYMLACFQDVKDNPFGKKYLMPKYENACKRLDVKVKDGRILIDFKVDDLFAPPIKDLPERIKSAIKSDGPKKRIAEDKVDEHLDAFPVKIRRMFAERCAPQDIADYLFGRLKTPRFSKLVKQMHESQKKPDELCNSLKGDWKSRQERADAILKIKPQEACKQSVYVGGLSKWFKDKCPEPGRFLLWLAVLMLRAAPLKPKRAQRCELLLTYYYSLFELGEDYGENWPRKLDYTLTYTDVRAGFPYTYFCIMFDEKLKESVESGLLNTFPDHDLEPEVFNDAVKENCEFNKKLKGSGLLNTFPDHDLEPKVFNDAVKENCAAVCAKQALNEVDHRLDNERRNLVQPRPHRGDFDWMTDALPIPGRQGEKNCVPVYAKYPGATVFAMSRSFLEGLMCILANNGMIVPKDKMIEVTKLAVQTAFLPAASQPADDSPLRTPGVSWVRVFAQLQGHDNMTYAYVAVFPSHGGDLSPYSVSAIDPFSGYSPVLLPVLGRRLVVLEWDINRAIDKYEELCTSDNGSPAFGGYQKINGQLEDVDGDSPNPFAMYFKPNIKKE